MIRLERTGSSALLCPYCKDDLAELPAIECGSCGVGHHVVCAEELKECATAGCSAPLVVQPCAHCHEEIGVLRRECPGCATLYHPSCAQTLARCACRAALREPQPAVYRQQSSRPSESFLTRDSGIWIPVFMGGVSLVAFPLGLWAVMNVRTSTLDRVAPYITGAPLVVLGAVALIGLIVKAFREYR